jgi:hypothetical protein
VKHISVLDMAGNVVYGSEVISQHMEINTSAMSPGVYVLQITGSGKTGMTKFVKQ